MTTAKGMVCHTCEDTTRAERGCSKHIADPALAARRDKEERTCVVDLEVEGWYWRAVEDASALASGALSLDDVTLVDLLTAQEVDTARQRMLTWRAESGSK